MAKSFNAVWDTGATASVISQPVVDQLNLKPVGMIRVRHADGESMQEKYLVNIMLPHGVGFPFVEVTKAKLSGLDVLIGMDIIGMGDLTVSNFGGQTVFSFRSPSVQTLSFIPNTPAGAVAPLAQNGLKPHRPTAGVGRNDPCPCKSGKKFKHCCQR